jgi:hypothetical protein
LKAQLLYYGIHWNLTKWSWVSRRVKLELKFVELGFIWDDNGFGVEFENIKKFSKRNNNDYKSIVKTFNKILKL